LEIAISRFQFGCVVGIVLGIIDRIFSPADGHAIIVMGIIVMGIIVMGIIVMGIIVCVVSPADIHTKFVIYAIRCGRL
jgi:hypothetical protein